MTGSRPGASWRPSSVTCATRTRWCWACPAAGWWWPRRWRGPWGRRWTPSWSASSVFRSSPSWPWGPSARTGSGSSSEDVMRRAGVSGRRSWRRRRAAGADRAGAPGPAAIRGDGGRLALDGRTAIVVDDGIATGSTAYAACRVARAHGAARVVLAVPVGSPEAVAALADVADEVRCLETPVLARGHRAVLRELQPGRRR